MSRGPTTQRPAVVAASCPSRAGTGGALAAPGSGCTPPRSAPLQANLHGVGIIRERQKPQEANCGRSRIPPPPSIASRAAFPTAWNVGTRQAAPRKSGPAATEVNTTVSSRRVPPAKMKRKECHTPHASRTPPVGIANGWRFVEHSGCTPVMPGMIDWKAIRRCSPTRTCELQVRV